MFRDSSDGIEEYTTSVTGFINKCIDDVIPTVTVSTYHNHKPWITGNICTEIKGRAATFKERDSNPEAYKKSRYALRRTIKQAKRCFEASNTETCMRAPTVPDDCDHTLRSRCKTFKQVNIHKAAGPDGLTGLVLRACTDQLASVFTDIFNLSLSVCNTYMFQADHHSPCIQEH